MTREQLRQQLYNELAYREVLVGCLRKIISNNTDAITPQDIDAWADKAEETTKGLDLLVGAVYEFLHLPKEAHEQRSAPIPPPAVAQPPPRRPAVVRPPEDDEPPF